MVLPGGLKRDNNFAMKTKRVKNIITESLSNRKYILNNITFDYQLKNGKWVTQTRECYDRGDGAAILLFNKSNQTIILTKQFRMPTFVHTNGEGDGFLLEVCAGLLDGDRPEDCIKREIEEETGFRVEHVIKIFEAYSSPGVLTEKLHYFIAEYSDAMKVSDGGGLESEHEDIEVLEIPFIDIVSMLNNGKIEDTRTIVLIQYAIINKLLL